MNSPMTVLALLLEISGKKTWVIGFQVIFATSREDRLRMKPTHGKGKLTEIPDEILYIPRSRLALLTMLHGTHIGA